MPFIRALADGSLPEEAFAFYLAQDAAYLVEFSRALAMASALAPDRAAQSFFATSAHVALDVETDLHRRWLSAHPAPPEAAAASPVTVAYTNHLLATGAAGSFGVLVAALLPCYWLYAHIGDALLRQAGNLDGHPYAAWIGTYADVGFQESARTACAIADAAAEVAPAEDAAMLAAFDRSCLHEYLFFDQGISRPRWPRPEDL